MMKFRRSKPGMTPRYRVVSPSGVKVRQQCEDEETDEAVWYGMQELKYGQYVVWDEHCGHQDQRAGDGPGVAEQPRQGRQGGAAQHAALPAAAKLRGAADTRAQRADPDAQDVRLPRGPVRQAAVRRPSVSGRRHLRHLRGKLQPKRGMGGVLDDRQRS